MKTIITIQHTQSEQHINKMIGSSGNWNLTELGIKQAHTIGKNLADEFKNQKFIIFSSDLPRAKQTAEIIAGYIIFEIEMVMCLKQLTHNHSIFTDFYTMWFS